MIENLFTTTIGSHLWSMNDENSDLDLFRVYVASTRDIIKGTANLKSIFTQKDNVDIHIHEVGKVINQLIKGNVNFLIGTMSPIVNSCYTYREDIESEVFPYTTKTLLENLQNIIQKNLSKNCYHSIHGLAVHNYKKYIESNLDNTERRRAKIIRVLYFGIVLLQTGNFEFLPKTGKGGAKVITDLIYAIDEAYRVSTLPEKPNAEPFRDWLYDIRIRDLENGR